MGKHPNQRQGDDATNIVVNEWNLDEEHTSWYDAINPRTGAKFECKSTHTEYSNGAKGRFRLWRSQHQSLTSAEASGTAWYVFVLFESDGKLRDIRRMKPSTVTQEIDHWNLAGHNEKIGRQYKLPWDRIF